MKPAKGDRARGERLHDGHRLRYLRGKTGAKLELALSKLEADEKVRQHRLYLEQLAKDQ